MRFNKINLIKYGLIISFLFFLSPSFSFGEEVTPEIQQSSKQDESQAEITKIKEPVLSEDQAKSEESTSGKTLKNSEKDLNSFQLEDQIISEIITSKEDDSSQVDLGSNKTEDQSQIDIPLNNKINSKESGTGNILDETNLKNSENGIVKTSEDQLKSETFLEKVTASKKKIVESLNKNQLEEELKAAKEKQKLLELQQTNLDQIRKGIENSLSNITNSITVKENLKAKLAQEKSQTEESKQIISNLNKEITDLKNQEIKKQEEFDNTNSKLQVELSLLEQTNQLTLKQLNDLQDIRDQEAYKEFLINLSIVFGVFFSFFLVRIGLALYNKYKPLKKYEQIIQIFYIFSGLFLTFFSILMLLIFNKELIVFLLFLGSAIVISMKEYTQAFIASLITIKVFSLGDYVTISGKSGKICRFGLLSFILCLIDKDGKTTGEQIHITNSTLLGQKELKGSKKMILEESISIKNLSNIKGGFPEIKNLLDKYTTKNNLLTFELTDKFEDKHGLTIVWNEDIKTIRNTKKQILKKINELYCQEINIEVKQLNDENLEELLAKYDYKINKVKENFIITFNILNSNVDKFNEQLSQYFLGNEKGK